VNVEITAKLFSFFRELTLRDVKNSFALVKGSECDGRVVIH